jgi:hypothetical protein
MPDQTAAFARPESSSTRFNMVSLQGLCNECH